MAASNKEDQIRSVGIDLGKTTFHLVALGTAGKVLVRKKKRGPGEAPSGTADHGGVSLPAWERSRRCRA